MLVSIWFLSLNLLLVKCDNFPSLLDLNATLAIIIDREYIEERYDEIKYSIIEHMANVQREILKHGGVNIQYYSWTTINIKDLTAILSVASCSDTWKIFNFAQKDNILHMAITDKNCPRLPSGKAIVVPLLDDGSEIPQMILDLRVISAYKWKSTTILHDNTLDRDSIEEVVKSLTPQSLSNFVENGASIKLMQLNTDVSLLKIKAYLRKILASIKSKNNNMNFLVLIKREKVEILMELAKKLQLTLPTNQWLYVISDTNYNNSNISSTKSMFSEGENISFIYNVTKSAPTCKRGLLCYIKEMLNGFVLSLDLAIVDEFELSYQVSDEEWEAIRQTKPDRREFLLRGLQNHLRHFGECGNCTCWKIEAAETWGVEYSGSDNPDYKLIDVGSWSPSKGAVLNDALFPHIEHGFRRKNLPVVSFHNPPWQILTFNETGSVLTHEGLVFDILKEMANNLNFTFTVQVPKEMYMQMRNETNSSRISTGYYNQTRNNKLSNFLTNVFPRSIEELIKTRSVIMAACALTIKDDYKNIVNFTSPINIQSYTFLVARPKELSRALLFLSPFTDNTWLCLGLAIIGMGPALFAVNRLSPVYEYKGIEMKGGLYSIQNCMWYMYGALLQQGGMHLPFADSSRIIVGTWWIVVIIVVTTYCGSLVAFLTFPKMDNPIDNIEDIIAKKETLTWSIIKGSFMDEQLKISQEDNYKTLNQGIKYSKYDEKLVENVAKGKHVHFDWLIKLHFYMQNYFETTGRCDLTLGSETYFEERIGIAIPPDLPYLNMLNYQIKRLHQTGLIEKWFKGYLPKKNKCFKNQRFTEVTNHTVNLDDMQGSFFVLLLGFTLALIWLIGEKCWQKRTRRRTQITTYPQYLS